MNSKIKNYVDVLFSDLPNTKKSRELKEEVLSNLNEHFEAHLNEGMGENQAYTESLKDLGDVDELLSAIVPDRELKKDIDIYRKKRARNYSISVGLIIFGVVALIGFGAAADIMELNEDLYGVIGLIIMLVCIGIGVGVIIYTNLSAPQDVADYLSKNEGDKMPSKKGNKVFEGIMSAYWPLVVALYMIISFATGAWHITWIIFLIAPALRNFLYSIQPDDEE